MTTLLIIIGMIAIVAAILDHASGMDRKPKPKKKKKSRKRSEWDDDPFFESRNQRRKRNRVNVLNGTTILSLELHFRRLIDEEGWD